MMLGMNLSMAGNPSQITVIQQAIAVLRKFGLNAHIYLPGVGMLNGLTAANYLDSAGTTAGTVDQPVGLVLDAAGSLGVELVTDGGFDTGVGALPYVGRGTVTAGASSAILTTTSITGASGVVVALPDPLFVTAGTYEVRIEVLSRSVANGSHILRVSPSSAQNSGVSGQLFGMSGTGVYRGVFSVNAGDTLTILSEIGVATIGDTWTLGFISVREVTGIAASQPTTANKSVLKLTNGRYNWLFDSTDLLTATYPAGYESVTVIDARSTGQVTTAGANIVGTYSMGPSVTLYGRMIIRVAVSPSDLALLQGFANRLAGL